MGEAKADARTRSKYSGNSQPNLPVIFALKEFGISIGSAASIFSNVSAGPMLKAHAQHALVPLRCSIPRQRARRLDLAAQPLRVHIETIRPGRRAILKKYAREICGIAQRFDHRAGPADDGGEIVLSRHAVAERCAQAMSAATFE